MSDRFSLAILVIALACSGCSLVESTSTTWNGWMEKSKRDAAEAVREIKKDWDLHEGEGVENFGGGAAEQVRELRGEMDRSATMSTY
jgi:hypothetical protein